MSDDFLERQVPVLGKKVHRLGLAMNYGIDAGGMSAAIDHGVNYFFWTPFRTGAVTPVLKAALARDREKYVVATGPTLGFFDGGVRRGAEKLLKLLGTDYLDVFQLFWVGVTSAITQGTLEALARLKEEKKIRAIGVSIHDRARAGRLAEDSPIDLFMLRYNAAHPGAERDVFPHLAKRHPAVTAYTATSWQKLLKRPKKWDGPAMTPADCYRFCLSNPNVDVTLCGPKTRAQLEENLTGLAKGPLSADEDAWMRRFGKAVHG
jgi:aryl-alcohol dehydrogenase-like predicted oxidoreductase